MFENSLKDKKILLCVSASIAFYKAYEILSLLKKCGANVRVAMSENTLNFAKDTAYEALSEQKVLCAKNDRWASGESNIA